MAEFAAITETLQSLQRSAGAPAMATVVMVRGSAFRRPGARMFVYPNGRRTGTVSGGCLEADVADRARGILRSGAPEYVLYDSRGTNGDVVVELGCGGAVGMLIEPAASASARRCLEFLASLGASRGSGAVATVSCSEGPDALPSGARFSQGGGGCAEMLAAGGLADLVTAGIRETAQTDRAYSRTVTIVGSYADILFEPVIPPIALLVCGGGPDAFALAHAARSLGWSTDVAENRPWRSDADRGFRSSGANRTGGQAIDGRTAVVIMTHNYARDLEWLRLARLNSAFYVGLLGPKHRTQRMINDLEETFGALEEDFRMRLHGPAGLDIGAETPDEIAVSIVAEIRAAAAGRAGGSLTSRTTSIHSD